MPEIIIENGPQKGQRISLQPPGPFICGRDSKAAITVKDPMVSRSHCRIELKDENYFLFDSGSANGTYLNGNRRKIHTLATGDRIKVGETMLTFFPDKVDDHLIGKVISGFEVLERVGQGGMGTVYKARQLSLDRMVALKVLSRELAEDHSFIEAFHREARAAGQINHPSIVQVYDVDTIQLEDEEITFFAMEYMHGGSVEDLLNKEKKLSPERALEITLDTARGLQFAEKRGMVHRDIKPGNLMVSESGMVKIGDLGIARHAEDGNKVSQKDGVSGSPHYISPEQARGEDLDSGADMYSLGISLFHMIAGRPPFIGTNAKDLVLKHLNDELPEINKFSPGIDTAVVTLLRRMTKKERGDRHADVGALVEELKQVLGKVHGISPGGAAIPVVKRTFLFVGILAILVALGTVGGVAISMYRHAQKIAANEINFLRTNLQESLDELELLIVDRDLENATAVRQKVQLVFQNESRYISELQDQLGQFQALKKEIIQLEADLEKEKQYQEAATAYQVVVIKIPPDLGAISTVEKLDSLLPPLEKFMGEHPDTPAAEEAGLKIEAIQEARKNLTRTLRRAREALDALNIKVKAFLSFDPPAYKSANEAIRAFIAEVKGTSFERQGAEKLASVELEMVQYASSKTNAYVNAPEGQKSDALRQLQRIRHEVEGKALEIIDDVLGDNP